MRPLTLCLLTLSLSGCSFTQKTAEPVTRHMVMPARTENAPIFTPAKLYKNASELLNKPFRDLGKVSGEDCQSDIQNPPASFSAARKKMQLRASHARANAVLLHKCEIVTGIPGCYRQIICQGTALDIAQ